MFIDNERHSRDPARANVRGSANWLDLVACPG
jgi:hypothetical protein